MTTTPEVLALARVIGFETWRDQAVAWRRENKIKVDETWIESGRREHMRGGYDGERRVQAAFAAIQRTTELAAKLADDQAALWKRNPSLLNGDWNEQDAMRAIECGRLAGKYRSFDHLKGVSQ